MKTTKREAIDMSATAIARRLEQVRALYKLMVSLRGIRMDGTGSNHARSP
jgi:hypothetical protein